MHPLGIFMLILVCSCQSIPSENEALDSPNPNMEATRNSLMETLGKNYQHKLNKLSLGRKGQRISEWNSSLAKTLEPYFSGELLGKVRIFEVGELPTMSFSTLGMGKDLSEKLAISNSVQPFGDVMGMTFDKEIFLRKGLDKDRATTLFHELVHVVQYDILGTHKFIELYLNYSMTGSDNPLENMAYEMETIYNKGIESNIEQEIRVRVLQLVKH